jgi:hypothetical protein
MNKTNDEYEDVGQDIYETAMDYAQTIMQIAASGNCTADGLKEVDKKLKDLRDAIEESLDEFWAE